MHDPLARIPRTKPDLATVMLTLKRSVPRIRIRHRISRSKGFHGTSFIEAQSARSPRTRNYDRQSAPTRGRRPYDIEDSLPPMALLNSARESGALAIEPDKALEFLRQFHHLALDLNYSAAGWERKLCAGMINSVLYVL